MSGLADPKLQALIDRLQGQSQAQEADTGAFFAERSRKAELDWKGFDETSHRFLADKLVALEPDKAEFCHLVCRSLRARRIVEVGTSYGVSTLYLADALRQNGGGTVIATENEAAKAAAARANFAEAELSDLIDLREGDLRETLKVIEGPVDFVLMDIWVEMARPAIELIHPHLRPGAVVIADNTISVRKPYGHFFAFLDGHGYQRTTLPFAGGLEFIVKAEVREPVPITPLECHFAHLSRPAPLRFKGRRNVNSGDDE